MGAFGDAILDLFKEKKKEPELQPIAKRGTPAPVGDIATKLPPKKKSSPPVAPEIAAAMQQKAVVVPNPPAAPNYLKQAVDNAKQAGVIPPSALDPSFARTPDVKVNPPAPPALTAPAQVVPNTVARPAQQSDVLSLLQQLGFAQQPKADIGDDLFKAVMKRRTPALEAGTAYAEELRQKLAKQEKERLDPLQGVFAGLSDIWNQTQYIPQEAKSQEARLQKVTDNQLDLAKIYQGLSKDEQELLQSQFQNANAVQKMTQTNKESDIKNALALLGLQSKEEQGAAALELGDQQKQQLMNLTQAYQNDQINRDYYKQQIDLLKQIALENAKKASSERNTDVTGSLGILKQEEKNIRPIPVKPRSKGAGRKETTLDREIAKQYADWVGAGGYSGAQNSLAKLDNAIKTLESRTDISGPYLSMLPDAVRRRALAEGARIKADVESVVMGDMRKFLGPQFTETEGKQMLQRSFEPAFDEKTNAERIRQIKQRLLEEVSARNKTYQFFENSGQSMLGFKAVGGSGGIAEKFKQTPELDKKIEEQRRKVEALRKKAGKP